MLAHQLAQHKQCRPQWLLDGCGIEIGQQRGDFFPVVIGPLRDGCVGLRTELALAMILMSFGMALG
jgi:hypothetical protein